MVNGPGQSTASASNALALVSCWRITSADRYLAALPLFHVHGLGNGLCSWLLSGCQMRLVERFEAGPVRDRVAGAIERRLETVLGR